MEVVEREGRGEGNMERDEGIAVVHESLIVERWDGQAFLLISGEYRSNEKLEKEVSRVDFPGVKIGTRILIYFRTLPLIQSSGTHLGNVCPHTAQKRFNLGNGIRMDELAIIEPKAYPQVVHEDRETGHNGNYPPRTTEFISNKRS